MKSSRVCVDASLAVLWVMPTQKTMRAVELLNGWDQDSVDLIVPPLFHAEVTSAIRLHVFLKRTSPEEGEEAFRTYTTLAVRTVNPPGLSRKAWELAKEYDRPRTYDMQYVAVAELEDCELWTGDMRLINSLKGKNRRVRWVGTAGKKNT